MTLLTFLGGTSMLFVIAFTWTQAMKKDTGHGQSKRASLVEAWGNIVIGFTINFVANLWLIPLMTGAELPHAANWWGGWVYTTLSILRQFALRRWFNQRLHLFASRVTKS